MTKYITIPAPSNISYFFGLFIDKNKAFVAGGALRSVFKAGYWVLDSKESKPLDLTRAIGEVQSFNDLKDIDLFFRSENDFTEGLNEFKRRSETEIFYETDNSVGLTISWDTPVLDLVRRDFHSIEDTLNRFDFTIAQCAFYKDDNGEHYLTFSEDFLNDIFYSRIRYSESALKNPNQIIRYPLERVMRYVDYGYSIDEQTAKQSLQTAINKYPELNEVKNSEEFTKQAFSSEICSQEGFKNLMSSIGYKRKDWGGSFSTGYALERSAVRTTIQNIVEPKFDGKEYLNKYGEKYGKYTLPYDHESIGLTTARLLEFLESKEQVIGKDNLKILTHFLFSYNFAVDESFENIHCNVCRNRFSKCAYGKVLLSGSKNKMIKGHSGVSIGFLSNYQTEEGFSNTFLKKFSENSIEVVYKAFMINKSDDDWVYNTACFFIDYAASVEDMKVSLKSWHKFLDEKLFDPTLPPSLTLSLVADEV